MVFSKKHERLSSFVKPARSLGRMLFNACCFVEQAWGHRFQSCLLNLYHTGEEGLGWHSDGERTPVASLYLGAARRFVFKNKIDKETIEITLAHGDLLVMEGETQDHWQHRVPPMKRVREPRINLTFRQVG
ncbi:alpha-ketoglutarate-dependent dioxygenase AlkB [Ruegeria sp. 2205SS24-7]|uniref:alpha-ketoglutarate-dependent dioxygenase AlkB family protein n=1 Tax=Ruegeria discodermiae TaxID=3064389 RepID=UPI0027424D4A|nr:alpha-ketoglutarate-dependent dioxygenase AlkB [Ruegeria sp. 2205SS24-7]MDP5220094.1 alpha-ketoglutarate-dependent dioxygenase AlkB [Ruegeria sp. 2205SS24-7]